MIKNRGGMLFSASVLVFVLFMVGTSFAYGPQARLVPLAVGLATLTSTLFVLRGQIQSPPLLQRLKQGLEERPGTDKPPVRAEDSVPPGNPGPIILWIIGFFLSVVLLGFHVSISLFTLVFLKFKGKVGWARAVLSAGILGAAVFLVFEWALGVRLFQGWIFGAVMPPI